MTLDKALKIGNDLARMAKTLAELAEELKADSDTNHDVVDKILETEPAREDRHPDISEVRGLLAEKSRVGHTEEIRTLLAKHGVKKLSEVVPTEYAALMEEARALE